MEKIMMLEIQVGKVNLNPKSFLFEPISSVSDLLLAVFCFVLFLIMWRLPLKKNYVQYWSLFFLFVSLSTFFGGVAHGIEDRTNNIWYDAAWLSMQLFTGAALLSAQFAVLRAELENYRVSLALLWVARAQFLLFGCCVMYFMDFKVVAINSGMGMAELLLFCIPSESRNFYYRSLICLGLLTSFITIYVNRYKVILAPWFNQHDLSHVIIFISLLLIYKGVRYKYELDSLFESK